MDAWFYSARWEGVSLYKMWHKAQKDPDQLWYGETKYMEQWDHEPLNLSRAASAWDEQLSRYTRSRKMLRSILPPGLDLPALASRAPYWFSQWALIWLTSALLLITTSRSSNMRLAWIPCCLYMLHSLVSDIATFSPASSIKNTIGGLVVVVPAQHLLSIFIFIRPGHQELAQGGVYGLHERLVTRVVRTVGFLYNLRGIGTRWQINKINPQPSFLTKHSSDNKPSRVRFLLRQICIIAWQWLFLDLLYEGALQQTPEERFAVLGTDLEFIYSGLTAEQWVHRSIVGFCGWLGPARVFLDLPYRIVSVVSVTLGLSNADKWPPVFGSVSDLQSIRSFWGTTWHQLIRRPLTTVSSFTTRDILKLPHPSLLERYLNLIIVFTLSGAAHVLAAWYDPAYSSSAYLPTLAFFVTSAVGIMFEDGVQALWRSLNGGKYSKTQPFWIRAVGFIWLAAWMTLTAPWMVYPPSRFERDYSWFVPVRVVPFIGASGTGGLLAIGALILVFGFGARF
ncbi:membrane bound o-acyl transferase family protein [Sarocladium implicatum]|nr:membrane bound o-acyl transferase family protein [Sarocladium implicatum]